MGHQGWSQDRAVELLLAEVHFAKDADGTASRTETGNAQEPSNDLESIGAER